MIRNKFKKLIALASAAAMVISCLPAMAAVDLPAEIPSQSELLTGEVTYTSQDLWTSAVTQQNTEFEDQTGDFVLRHTLTINTPLAEGTYQNNTGVNGITSNARRTLDSFFVKLESASSNGKGNIGAAFMAKHYDEAQNAQSFCWKSGEDTAGAFYTYDNNTGSPTEDELYLKIGETYTMQYDLTNVGNGNGANLTLTIFDSTGTIVSRTENLDMRNLTSDSSGKNRPVDVIAVQMTAREAGKEASVTIGDLYKVTPVPTQMEVKANDTELNTTSNELEFNLVGDTVYNLSAKSLGSDGTDLSAGFPVTLGISQVTNTDVAESAPVDADTLGITFENNVLTVPVDIAAGTYSFDITAVVGNGTDTFEDTEIKFPVSIQAREATDAERVAAVKDTLTIDNLSPTADFTVPTAEGDVAIAWSASDDALAVNGGNVLLMPTEAGTVTLTATISYGEASDKKEFTIDLTDYYNNTVKKAVDDAVADKTVNPNDDRTGSYGTPDAAEGKFALDTFTAENPLSFDLYLPSSVSGNSNLKQTWSVTGDGLDVDGEVAALAVDNTEAVTASISKTVAFVKNGTTLYSASAEQPYSVTVQFDPAAVDEMTDKWAETSGEEDVKSTFFYAYQLKLDAASEENFADMPDEGTDISTSGISNLNYGGEDSVFGSLIEWTSSQSTYASVSKSNKKVTVNRSSFSGTKDITLTATIYIEGYSKNETRAFKYEITGTKSSSSSGGSSGRPSTGGGGTIPVPVVTPTPAPVVTPTPADEAFDDIEGVESWAGDAIRALYSEGVISGKGDKKFAPYDNVTRGEFAKMIVGAFNLSEMPDEYRGFTDVPSGHWCFSYVEVAANAGIVNGYEDGSFGIDDYITRQDMAVMVVRAAEAAGVEIADAGSSVDFGDSASIADYASAAVESLVKAGIINGIDGNFEPASNANRAQAAKILANFI